MPSLRWTPVSVSIALLHLFCLVTETESFPGLLDRVSSLPGQPEVGFGQYSGYVTVDGRKQRALFYYFAEAEQDPASKPLVLWLNGGPGCSSLGVGAFSENGPFRPSGEVLVRNEYSWNREANMLYLETPVGVGFSYSTDTSSYESVNDKITGMQLQRFFTPPILQCKKKVVFEVLFGVQSWSSNPLGFYEYAFFPFMMMSDSCTVFYSCCFVLFLFGFDKKRSEAFQTFMHVASPFHASSFSETSLFLSSIARDNVVFLQRWFVKFPQYKKSSLFITGESYAGHYVPQLAELMLQINKKQKLFNLKGIALGNPLLEFATNFNSRAEFFWSHGLISDSTYRMFTSVCNYSRYVSEYARGSISPLCSKVMGQVTRETSKFVDKYDVTLDVCISSVLSQSKRLSPQHVTTETIDVCIEDETVNYLNRRDVQSALHARLVGVRRWDVCSNVLDYELLDLEIPTITIMGKLIKAGILILVYSGDQDSVIPLTGSRTLVHGLAKELGLNTTIPYRVWFEGQQVGGWTQVYGNVLSFATIRGASHEAPFSQPKRSLVLFQAFLHGQPLPEAF